MSSNAAVETDELITRIAHKRDANADTLFAGLADHPAMPGLAEQGAAEFLRRARPSPDADLLASALLRLAAIRRAAIDESSVRVQAVEFLDRQYGDRLRPYYERPQRGISYEVLNALVPVAPNLEQRATEIVEALRSIDNIETQRQALLKLLNSSAGKILFRPFLPRPAAEVEIQQAFAAAIEVRSTDNRDEIGAAFRRMNEAIELVEKAVESEPTVYGRQLLLGITESLQIACEQRRELKSPPAKLDMRTGDRPIPLLDPAVTTSFELQVVNDGEAMARDVELTFSVTDGAISLPDPHVQLGRMEPRKREDISVTLVVTAPSNTAAVRIEARWTNADRTVGKATHDAQLNAQETFIDWDGLETAAPYSPYPVEDAEKLVGRERQLETLKNHYRSKPLANLYLTGQRRIGKTSLIRVMQQELKSQPDLVIANVEIGEVRARTAIATIARLGSRLSKRAIQAASLESEIPVPTFEDSLAPLTDVVEAILAWNDDLSFLFVIDEFDELPQEAYRRNGPGDALFVPMRSLAQKPNVGWLLVGGERMPFIRDEQAARLNTFNELSLDHLALGDPGGRGFGELMRSPLPDGFHVDDTAVRYVFDESAGNPHFAKEICSVMFEQATARRDAYVSTSEVEDAVSTAARVRDVELFAHFWEDGIFERKEAGARRELQRRAYLTTCAEVLRTTGSLNDVRVRQAGEGRDLAARDLEQLRAEFMRRGILKEENGDMVVGVPFFRRWLEVEGIYRLPAKGISEQTRQEVAKSDQALRVAAHEIKRLTKSWTNFRYLGERVTRGDVERWLDQFDTPVDRRIAFRLLERLHPIDDGQTLEGFRRLQRIVARESRVHLARGQRALNHLYISSLDENEQRRQHFGMSYAGANTINKNNIVDPSRLIDRLNARHSVTAVVLVSDFVGVAQDAVRGLDSLAERIGELSARPAVQWFLFGASGLPAAATEIANSQPARKLGLRVDIAHPIGEADLPLNDASTVFSHDGERDDAREILTKYGERIQSPCPLGSRSQVAPVVFSCGCPTGAAAVLWTKRENWNPLFPVTSGP